MNDGWQFVFVTKSELISPQATRGSTNVTRCAERANDGCLLLACREYGSEPRLAAHHVFVGFIGVLQRKDFGHRADAGEQAEIECILRIDGAARRRADNRASSQDERNPRHVQRLGRGAEDD